MGRSYDKRRTRRQEIKDREEIRWKELNAFHVQGKSELLCQVYFVLTPEGSGFYGAENLGKGRRT